MAAGGFKEFVAGETLDQDEINDFLMQGVLVFAGTAARGSAITSPVEGQFCFLKDTDGVEFYDGSAWVELAAGGVELEYLVVGAGAGGARHDSGYAGGAGAGGYRCNVSGENSGGGASAEAAFSIAPGVYKLTLGAGGAGATVNDTAGNNGGDSFLGPIISVGGGRGGSGATDYGDAFSGGSGGGHGNQSGPAPIGTSLQGFGGGQGFNGGAGNRHGGGGGGASQAGADGTSPSGQGDGGDGVASSITGSSVTRAGGGGGASTDTPGTGGTGGGGAGTGVSGTANTGGGGGGRAGGNAGNGGSGVVIFSVPTGTSVSFSGGVTESSAVVSGKDVYTVTAAGPTDTVTIG